MKVKKIDGSDIPKSWLKSYDNFWEELNQGYVSYFRMNEIAYPITVDYDDSDVILTEAGYQCIMFMPKNEHYCISAYYDEKDQIIELYFDIIKEQFVDEDKVPGFKDLYLDVAVAADGYIAILDEDELNSALEENIIDKKDFELAWETCNQILDLINAQTVTESMNNYLIKYKKCV